MIDETKRRRLTPSRAVKVGAPVGGSLAMLLVAAANAAGLPMTPEIAAALATLVTAATSWLTRGGRQGESE